MKGIYNTWIEKYPSISKFKKLIERGRMTENTVRNYVSDIHTFCTFLGFDNPESALEYIKSVKEKEEWIDDLVSNLSKEYGNTRCTSMFKGVKKWLDLNRVDLDWRDVILPSVSRKVEDRAPTKEELKRILSVANIRDKAIVLVASSSGLRANTLRTLTFGDVNFEYPDVASVMVKREYTVNGKLKKTGRKISKTKKFYVTFITPEAKKALLDYRKYREEQGEKITDISPLFTSSNRRNRGKMLGRVYFSIHWGRLLKRAHLDTKSEGWNILHFHTLKKFAKTQFINAGCKPSYSEFWLGHKGAYLEDSYFRGEETEHLKEYRKAIPHLSVIEAPMISREELRREMFQQLPDELFERMGTKYGMTAAQIKNTLARTKTVRPLEREQKKRKLMAKR